MRVEVDSPLVYYLLLLSVWRDYLALLNRQWESFEWVLNPSKLWFTWNEKIFLFETITRLMILYGSNDKKIKARHNLLIFIPLIFCPRHTLTKPSSLTIFQNTLWSLNVIILARDVSSVKQTSTSAHAKTIMSIVVRKEMLKNCNVYQNIYT